LATANAIREYLLSLGVSVLDWTRDVRAGRLKDAMERTSASCATAIFLFGSDDEIALRDNLIFELGYFIRAKGWGRALVVCEAGSRLPPDLGGEVVYIGLKDRSDITTIQTHLRAFVHMRL
jgi:predicted nucleotide-binding protein